ncbi:PUA-like domain-containing protein [Tuber brumale]|nr:PUA-like domain-containing protein [Tuber brumale]
MAERRRIETVRDLRFKRIMKNQRPPAVAGASSTAESSTGRNTTAIKREAQADFEDNDNEVGPGLRDEAAARLLQRRNKRNPVVSSNRHSEQTRFSSNRVISRSDLIALSVHADTIARVMKKPSPNAADWQIVREALYQLPFENVDQRIVHSSGIMKQLLSIEENCFHIPEDVALDAQIILKRWRNGDYDPHLLRGIDLNQTITHVKGRGAKNVKRTRHYKLEEDYNWKRDDNVEGNHELFVGEWWPLQICALRDGAHGELEAGISGNNAIGAISVIVSGGALYPDLDELDRVLYCGTMGIDAPINYAADPAEDREPGDRIPSHNTKLLMVSYNRGTKIRLFRSAKSQSPYAPAEGLRYDGLYTIRAYEILDKKNAVYRFEMIRENNQPKIRGDPDDPGCKPNKVELAKWQGIKKTLKGER